MCEAHAFILRDGKEEKVLESVDLVELEGGEVKLVSIFGEQKIFKGRLRLYDNTKRKILFEPLYETRGKPLPHPPDADGKCQQGGNWLA